MSLKHYEWMLGFQQSVAINEKNLGIEGTRDAEDIRLLIADTNPYLLGATFAVSFLHLLFDVLAFKNDVSFWRRVEKMDGISWRTIVMSWVSEIVVLFYLCEQASSWLVVISSLFSILTASMKMLKLWQVGSHQNADVDAANIAKAIKRAEHQQKEGGEELEEVTSAADELTEVYDKLAFWYLAVPLGVIVLVYAAYTLIYEYHRGWLAWLLTSMASLVYGLGFVFMTPQLFINHKLRSVAALPWKPFMYKALNTVVDDLFAFIIRMPALHRISCFRDDIVFAILLYQMYLYPVDQTRLNEFGQRGMKNKKKGVNKKKDD